MDLKKTAAIILIIAGALSLIFGIICFAKSVGYTEKNEQYGGDAYTGIQNAGAQTANNVYNGNSIMRFGFGCILLVGGLALIAVGLRGLTEENNYPTQFGNSPYQKERAYSPVPVNPVNNPKPKPSWLNDAKITGKSTTLSSSPNRAGSALIEKMENVTIHNKTDIHSLNEALHLLSDEELVQNLTKQLSSLSQESVPYVSEILIGPESAVRPALEALINKD